MNAYVKNHNLGLEVPYRYGSEDAQVPARFHRAGGRRPRRRHEDLLHLIVEIKGYRREDAKDKKRTMETLLGSGREQQWPVRPLGLRRVH